VPFLNARCDRRAIGAIRVLQGDVSRAAAHLTAARQPR